MINAKKKGALFFETGFLLYLCISSFLLQQSIHQKKPHISHFFIKVLNLICSLISYESADWSKTSTNFLVLYLCILPVVPRRFIITCYSIFIYVFNSTSFLNHLCFFVFFLVACKYFVLKLFSLLYFLISLLK